MNDELVATKAKLHAWRAFARALAGLMQYKLQVDVGVPGAPERLKAAEERHDEAMANLADLGESLLEQAPALAEESGEVRAHEREFDRWFADIVVRPRVEAWGRGWARLSWEQKCSEIEAAMFVNLMGSARLDAETLDADNARALGRHVADLVAAYRRWHSANEPRE